MNLTPIRMASNGPATTFTFHSSNHNVVGSAGHPAGAARNTRHTSHGWFKVVWGPLSRVAALAGKVTVLGLWLALAYVVLDRVGEHIAMARETERQVRIYNESIAEMEAIAKRMRESQR